MTSPIVPKEKQEEKKSKLHKKSKTICRSSKCLRHALNIKTKCCSYKCERALRRKLHKYKLRPNGEEDPEILDVSHIFLSSCKIKSPTKLTKSPESYDFEELRPKNYLFKMARRKHKMNSESEPVVNNSKNTKATNVLSLQNGKITMYTKNKSPISNGCISADVQELADTKNNGAISEDSQETAITDSQKKNKTNAFKLLMDSRNKSIGCNSPGKEKNEDPSELEEIIEKKTNKAKRNLALQRMAEAKGALKNKEKEEQEERIIQIKMEERAERLKAMIANAKPKEIKKDSKTKMKNNKVVKKPTEKVNQVEEVIDVEKSSSDKKSSNKKPDTTKNPQDEVTNKAKTLHLVDIFKEVGNPVPKTISSNKKFIPKEDVEFLKKLSPSIKKKENMMCYFKKIEKKSDLTLSPEDTSEQSPVLKVKVSLKNKKKLKKRKLSLNKDATTEVLRDLNENSSNKSELETVTAIEIPKDLGVDEKLSKERRKRKRKENSVEIATSETNVTVNPVIAEKGRPKRSVKKPIKYVDDVQLTSSDEELHIFTPRKRRLVENKNISLNKEPSDEIVVSDEEIKPKTQKPRKTAVKDEKAEKKPVKLAPIFAPKPQLNTEQLEAKQKFLYSGVPEKIKKMISQLKKSSIEISNEFPVLVHVQQISQVTETSKTSKMPVLAEPNFCEEIPIDFHEDLFKKLVTPAHTETQVNTVPTQKSNTTAILQNIKNTYPKFPVYRTYRTLKSQSRGEFREVNHTDFDNSRELMSNITDIVNENPDYLNWTDKYKATSTKQMIGNFENIKEMKKWLTNWTDNEARTKAAKHDSDSSDFCYDSDSNSRDCIKSNNLLILTGPPGCGKTLSVYAVAAELAIKVIEVNASSKRTGKMMLQDLQEATQSHKVNRAGLENSQKIPEVVVVPILKTYKKRGRPKKSDVNLKKSNSKDEISTQSSQSSQPANSQEHLRTGMSLILVDDADIVFDQDDGFSSAIAQLIQSSKRPVILVTGSLSCPHLQRFLQCGKVIQMNPLLPRMLGTWLDLMCLADKGTCWPGLGARFLDYFKGDIRKTINCLQFHMTVHFKDNILDEASHNSDSKLSPDDESSNLSWPDSEAVEDKNIVQNSVKDVWNHIMYKELKLQHVLYPEKLFNVWWSIPSMLNNTFENIPQLEVQPKTNKTCNQKHIQELNAIANLIDSFSISDLISNINPDTTKTITSEPWYSSESDSVSELESFQGYNRSSEVTSGIIQNLVTSSMELAQTSLQCEGHTSIQFPSMTEQRTRKRILDRHEYLTDMMNASAALDRRALALDYWSTCRSICRIEKNKTDTVLKRNNRFCHYLRTSNAMARSEMFDSLADSLNCEGET